MENVETKKKINRLIATIVVGIFIAIAVFLTILSLTMNLKETTDAYYASTQEYYSKQENQGEMIIITGLVAGVGLLAILLFYYGIIIIPHLISISCIIPIIRTLNTPIDKPIRIINFVYIGLLAFVIVTTIVKFILYWIGIA